MKFKKINIKVLIIALSILMIVIGGVSFLITKNNKNNNLNNATIEVVNKEQVKRKIYVLSNDNIVVPLTITYDKKETLVDELYYLTSLLRKGSNIESNSYKGVIPSDTSIVSLSIVDRTLSLGLSKEFNNYDAKEEIRIIESLVWTYSQFEEIDALELIVDNNKLTKMPVGNTPLPNKLTKDFGINNHIVTPSLNTSRVVTYYNKMIDGKCVYVPVSVNVESLDVSVFLEVSKQRLPIYSGLFVNGIINDIDSSKVSLIDQMITFQLDSDCLVEESLVSNEIYSTLQVVFSSFMEDYKVGFIVENEEVKVEGVKDEESEVVGKTIYNEVII